MYCPHMHSFLPCVVDITCSLAHIPCLAPCGTQWPGYRIQWPVEFSSVVLEPATVSVASAMATFHTWYMAQAYHSQMFTITFIFRNNCIIIDGIKSVSVQYLDNHYCPWHWYICTSVLHTIFCPLFPYYFRFSETSSHFSCPSFSLALCLNLLVDSFTNSFAASSNWTYRFTNSSADSSNWSDSFTNSFADSSNWADRFTNSCADISN